MKRILALGLAAAVGVTTMTALTNGAAAGWRGGIYFGYDPGYYGYYHQPYYPYYYDPGPAIVAGAILGSVFGVLPRAGYYPRRVHRVYSGPASHDAWCSWRFRTYSSVTKMYFARPGVPVACSSPY